MSSTFAPNALHFLLLLFSGWVNRHQQDVIDYLKEENRVLREQLGGRRIRLNDDQRRRLAVKGNAYAERFVFSAKSECLGRIVPLGENHLRRAISSFVSHYHGERPHQGLDGKLIVAYENAVRAEGEVRCRERLGGMLKFYYRDAA